MRRKSLLNLSVSMILCLLSVTGCTVTSQPCRAISLPPLPTSVVDEAKRSSDLRTEVSNLQRDVQQSLQESSRP